MFRQLQCNYYYHCNYNYSLSLLLPPIFRLIILQLFLPIIFSTIIVFSFVVHKNSTWKYIFSLEQYFAGKNKKLFYLFSLIYSYMDKKREKITLYLYANHLTRHKRRWKVSRSNILHRFFFPPLQQLINARGTNASPITHRARNKITSQSSTNIRGTAITFSAERLSPGRPPSSRLQSLIRRKFNFSLCDPLSSRKPERTKCRKLRRTELPKGGKESSTRKRERERERGVLVKQI